MKIVKATQLPITTNFEGAIYTITAEGISVPDEIAIRMKEQFLHTIDVSDETVAPVEEKKESVDEESEDSDVDDDTN